MSPAFAPDYRSSRFRSSEWLLPETAGERLQRETMPPPEPSPERRRRQAPPPPPPAPAAAAPAETRDVIHMPLGDTAPLEGSFQRRADALVTLQTCWILAMQVADAAGEEFKYVSELISELKSENQQLKLTIAEMRGSLAEVTAKANKTSFIVQRLRELSKGDPGPPGPMGRDGRDGVQGPQGEKGPQGNRGQRGFETTGWLIDEENYTITPLYYDNSKGPTLDLYGLFMKFMRDTEDGDAEAEIEAARLKTAQLQLELERTRRGLSPT